jgi:hypothetical protein
MSRFFVILFFLTGACFAQSKQGRTSVFKVKAPLATCTINCKDTLFLLEKESVVNIVIKGRNAKTNVTVSGGEVRSIKGDNYTVRLFEVGIAVIRVYQRISTGTKLIGVRKFEVKPPELFFCGLKLGSTTSILKLGNCHMYAYSSYFKENLPVNKFTMLFYESVNPKTRKPIIDTLKTDTCRMTNAMKQRLIDFQPKTNKIYFYNLLCKLPDGSFRLLEPVELQGGMDTSVNTLKVMYSLKKKPTEQQ